MGQTWMKISDDNDLGVNACRDVWRDYRNEVDPAMVNLDAIKYVYELHERLQWLIQEFGVVYREAGDQGAVKVRALAEIGKFSIKQMEMLQLVGHIPSDLGSLKIELDARALITNIVSVFSDNDIGIDVQQQIMAVLNPNEPELRLIDGSGEDVDD
jgi:hypothetical protein